MGEMPSLNMPVQRLKVAILPLDLPCSGSVTHSGEILTTGKSHGWPRVMKYHSQTVRRNHGRPLKRLLDMWDRNGSTSGPTPWKIYDDDDDDDIVHFRKMTSKRNMKCSLQICIQHWLHYLCSGDITYDIPEANLLGERLVAFLVPHCITI